MIQEGGYMEKDSFEVRQCGTKNFYYPDPESSSMKRIAEFWNEAVEMMGRCPWVREEKKE